MQKTHTTNLRPVFYLFIILLTVPRAALTMDSEELIAAWDKDIKNLFNSSELGYSPKFHLPKVKRLHSYIKIVDSDNQKIDLALVRRFSLICTTEDICAAHAICDRYGWKPNDVIDEFGPIRRDSFDLPGSVHLKILYEHLKTAIKHPEIDFDSDNPTKKIKQLSNDIIELEYIGVDVSLALKIKRDSQFAEALSSIIIERNKRIVKFSGRKPTNVRNQILSIDVSRKIQERDKARYINKIGIELKPKEP